MSVRVSAVSLLVLSWCSAPQPLVAELPKLVADLGVSTEQLPGSRPRDFTAVAHGVVFVADGDESGLFVTDGTEAGTHSLALAPAECSRPNLSIRARIGGRAIVDAFCGETLEVWSTDGTPGVEARLFLIDDFSILETRWVEHAERLYFLAGESASSHGWLRLYQTDGTPSGSRVVVDRGAWEWSGWSRLLATEQRLIFFEGSYDRSRTRVWRSDGSEEGTVPIAELSGAFLPESVHVAGEHAFFRIGNGELWSTDGSAAGTRRVALFEGDDAIVGFPVPAVIGRTFYFFARESSRVELWASDGTRASTRRVTRLNPWWEAVEESHIARVDGELYLLGRSREEDWKFVLLAVGPTPESTRAVAQLGQDGYHEMAEVGGRLVFAAFHEETGVEPWSFEPRTGSVELLVDACLGSCWGFARSWRRIGQDLFFLVRGAGTLRLGRTDGTPDGTQLLTGAANLRVGRTHSPSGPLDIARVSDLVVFAALDARTGVEPYAAGIDGEGVSRLADLAWDRSHAAISDLGAGAASGELLFGESRWLVRTDGGRESTRRLIELPFGCCGLGDCGDLAELFELRGHFLATTGDCEEATVSAYEKGVGHVTQLFGPARPDRPAAAFVFFSDADGAEIVTVEEEGTTIWTTDGTDEGTIERFSVDLSRISSASRPNRRLVVVAQGPNHARVISYGGEDDGVRVLLDELEAAEHLARSRSRSILFVRPAGGGGLGVLLATDGTVEGTRTLAPIPEAWWVREGLSAEIGDRSLFAVETAEGPELWSSDGTPAGTQRLTGSWPPVRPQTELGFHPFRNGVAFIGLDSEGHPELWSTDGTPAGTRRLDDLVELGAGAEVVAARTLADRIVLAARPPGPGFASDFHWLWSTPGDVEAGGIFAEAFFQPTSGIFQGRFVPVGGAIVFPARTERHGIELWRTDGTSTGTRLLIDLSPGPASSDPLQLLLAGDQLYFTADDSIHGRELWTWRPREPSPCVPDALHACLREGRFRLEAFSTDRDGASGDATAVPVSDEGAAFWFFDPEALDLGAKVVDGRAANDHHWVFAAGLSILRFALTVRESETGEAWRAVNALGEYTSFADPAAFGPEAAPEATRRVRPTSAAKDTERPEVAGCSAGATRLCLLEGRFAVEVAWRDFAGHAGAGQASPWPGGESGLFWFFDPANVELIVKMVDGTAVNGRHWVYFGALSNVEYTVTVTDGWSGATKSYFNPAGRFASVGDVDAF